MIKGYAFVIASAFIFGCMPLMAKFIYAEGMNPLSLVFLRNLLSVPMLAACAKISGASLRIPKAALPGISLVSVMGCCLTPLLLFFSYQYINSGTATVLHYVYPAIVMLSGLIFLKHKTHAGNVISLVLCVVGIFLFFDPAGGFDPLGGALALVSGVTYAVYILLLSGFRYKDIPSFTFCFYVTCVSSLSTLVLCLVGGALVFPTSLLGWGLCLLFAFVLNVGAVVLFQRGTFLIGGERASILSTIEPITSIFAGVLVFNENLGIGAVIGSLLVLSASVLIAVIDARQKQGSDSACDRKE